METVKRKLAEEPERWTYGNIHDVAAYFHYHPEASGKEAFVNLYQSNETAYNSPLYGFLHYWYYRRQKMYGYIRHLSAGISFEDVTGEVTYFLLTEHDNKWDPQKHRFLRWIEFNLRQHSLIGNRLVQQWKPFKQTDKLVRVQSLDSLMDNHDYNEGYNGISDKLLFEQMPPIKDIMTAADYEELGRTYHLTDIEIFILLTYDEMKEDGASTLVIKKYLNCRLEKKAAHFQSAGHLENVIAQLRRKALNFHKQYLSDQ